MNIRIIGVGSPFGADSLGWEAADYLAQCQLSAEISKADRPGAALISLMRGADFVIILDAMLSGAPPGSVRVVSRDGLDQSPLLSNHGFGVAQSLALAEALGELPTRIAIVAIEAASDAMEETPAFDRQELLSVVSDLLRDAGH